MSLTLSCCCLSPINAFQTQERDRAISASRTQIKSNGVSSDASEIVRQIVHSCEGVRNAEDGNVILMIAPCTCTVCEMKRKRDKNSHTVVCFFLRSFGLRVNEFERGSAVVYWLLFLLIKSSARHKESKNTKE